LNIADEWIDWILTTSIEASEGLVADFVLQIWSRLREASVVLLFSSDLSKDRGKIRALLRDAAILAEKVPFSFSSKGITKKK